MNHVHVHVKSIADYRVYMYLGIWEGTERNHTINGESVSMCASGLYIVCVSFSSWDRCLPLEAGRTLSNVYNVAWRRATPEDLFGE